MTEAEFETERSMVFDSAKRASDFVGMIARLAFLQFAFLYFLREAPKTEGIPGFALGLCAVSSFGLSVFMARAIMRIIFLWEIRDVRRNNLAWMKVILFAFALASTLYIYFAVMHLVSAIASSNALISAN